MKKDRSYGSKYQRELLKVVWEAVRRSDEYRDDCEKIAQAFRQAGIGEVSLLPLENLPPEFQEMWNDFKQRWGCEPLPPNLSFDEVEAKLNRLYAQTRKATPKIQKGLKHRKVHEALWQKGRPQGSIIPLELAGMYNRLQGYDAKQPKPVRCLEAERDEESIKKFMGSGPYEKPPDPSKLAQYLNSQEGWPPREINFTIDLDAATEKDILASVRKEVRYYQGVRKKLGLSPAQPRYHLDKYSDYFKVLDMFEKRKLTADKIAQLMWPNEYKRYGGRTYRTAEKSKLIQRAYDHNDRATEIIKDMVDKVRDKEIKI